MENILKIRNLNFLGLIDYPDLDFKSAETVFITGASGCGKSSLLSILNATKQQSSGQIYYRDDDITSLDVIAYRKQVLLAPQQVYLLNSSIMDNYKFYYDMRDEPCPSDEKIRDYLKLCVTPFSPEDDCNNLSGGEKQRVFLSIFLSFAREILLLDEPTSALDHNTADVFFASLKTHCKKNGITPIIVCHSPELAEKHGSRIIKLEGGTSND